MKLQCILRERITLTGKSSKAKAWCGSCEETAGPSAVCAGDMSSSVFAPRKKPVTDVGLPWSVHWKPAVSSALLKMLWGLFSSFRGSDRRASSTLSWGRLAGTRLPVPLGQFGAGFDVCWPRGEIPLSVRRIAFPKGSIHFFKCLLSVNSYPVK